MVGARPHACLRRGPLAASAKGEGLGPVGSVLPTHRPEDRALGPLCHVTWVREAQCAHTARPAARCLQSVTSDLAPAAPSTALLGGLGFVRTTSLVRGFVCSTWLALRSSGSEGGSAAGGAPGGHSVIG